MLFKILYIPTGEFISSADGRIIVVKTKTAFEEVRFYLIYQKRTPFLHKNKIQLPVVDEDFELVHAADLVNEEFQKLYKDNYFLWRTMGEV